MPIDQQGTNSFAELESAINNAKTAANLKTAYESNSDTNAFTDSEKTKLNGLEDTLQSDLTATLSTAVGGVSNGNNFPSGTKLEAVLRAILVQYQTPLFTAFSVNVPTVLEAGDSIAAGSKTFSWTTSNGGNVDEVVVRDLNTSTDIITTTTNDGSEPYTYASPITLSTHNGTYQWRISGTNTNAQAMNTRTFTSYWYKPTFWAVIDNADPVNPPTQANVEAVDFTVSTNKVTVSNGKFTNKTLASTGWVVVLFPNEINASAYNFLFNAKYDGNYAPTNTVVASSSMNVIGAVTIDTANLTTQTYNAYAFPQRYIIDANTTELRIGVQ